MARTITLVVFTLALVVVAPGPVPAQLFTSKKPRVNPNQRVPELILICKTDKDERKRVNAAEELRDYDIAVFTEIVPVLADVSFNDKKQGVRIEALNSLAKIRPVSAEAAKAMEKAAAEDDAVRVRLHAKALLPKYHLALAASKKGETPQRKSSSAEAPSNIKGPSLFP